MDVEFGLSIVLKLDEGFKEVSDQLEHLQASVVEAQANETRVLSEQIRQLQGQFRSFAEGAELRAGSQMPVSSAEVLPSYPSKSLEAEMATSVPVRSTLSTTGRFKMKADWEAICIRESTRDEGWMNLTKIEDSRVEEDVLQKLQKFVTHPQSRFRLTWDIVGMILLLYDLITIPLTAFDLESVALTGMSWFTTLYWTCDMAASCLTGYYSSGKLVLVPQRIIRHYAQTWLLFDIIIIAPEWFALVIAADGSKAVANSFALLRILRVVRFLRLLRLVKVKQFFEELESVVDSRLFLLAIGVMKLSAALFLVVHGFACAWYGIGKLNDEEGWVQVEDFRRQSFLIRYIGCFQWAMQMFHPSRPKSKDLHDGTAQERVFELVTSMLGLICASLFISAMTNTMVTLQAVYSKQSAQKRIIENYVLTHGISPELSNVVKRQVQGQIDRITRQMAEVELTLLVAKPLLMDMREEARSPLLIQNSFFLLFRERHPRVVRRLCHEAFVELVAYQTEKIFSPNDAGDRMFFIESGYLLYRAEVTPDDDDEGRILKGGDSLSEAVLWVSHWFHLGQLEVTAQRAVLLALVASAFTKVLHNFPNAHAEASVYAGHFVDSLNSVGDADFEFFSPPPLQEEDATLEKVELSPTTLWTPKPAADE